MQMKDEEQQQQEQTQLKHYQQGKTFLRPAGCAYTTPARQGMFLLIYIYTFKMSWFVLHQIPMLYAAGSMPCAYRHET